MIGVSVIEVVAAAYFNLNSHKITKNFVSIQKTSQNLTKAGIFKEGEIEDEIKEVLL